MEEQFAADPGICRSIADLSCRQLRRSPVGCLDAFGNPDLHEDPGKISHASLAETVISCDGPQIQRASLLKWMEKLECADIIRQPDADLENAGLSDQLRRNLKMTSLLWKNKPRTSTFPVTPILSTLSAET